MNQTTNADSHPSPHRHHVGIWTLWFAIFGAPAAWSLQELTDAAVAGHACFPYFRPLVSPNFSALSLVVVVVGIGALLIAIAAWFVGWGAWRSTSNEHEGSHHALLEVGEGRTRFMAISGLIVSSIFILAVLLNTISFLFTAPCG